MTAIWFILAIMTGAAVLALLWPLTRRRGGPDPAQSGLSTETGFYEDQLAEIDRDLARGLIGATEAEAARTEAARRLLRASREGRTEAAPIAEPHLRQRRAASAFALSTIPLVALLVYGLYGSPNLPSQTEADRKAAQDGGRNLMNAIAQVEAKLASSPDDARGWSVIAPVYMRLGRFDDAARAYGQVVRLQGEDADRLTNWGEALVAAGEGSVSPQARKLFERAHALDPAAPRPQFYLARGDELAGDTAGAVRRLEALAAQGPADAPWMTLVRETIARLRGGAAPDAASKPNDGPKDQAAGSAPTEAASGPAGNPAALPPAERMGAIRGMVEGLDKRLSESGGSAEDWVRLVRSYAVLGERERAGAALERGRKALAQDADGLARLDAEARSHGLAAAGTETDGAAPQGLPQPGPAPMMPGHPSVEPGASPEGATAAAIRAMPPAERESAIRGMVAGLDRRLAAKGGSLDEWMRLVRSYAALGDRLAAAGALDRARMALAADKGAAEPLDALGRELDLKGPAAKP